MTWVDNCISKDKSWVLYITIINELHREGCIIVSVTIKYLEKGHIFKSADSVYHKVEAAMKKQKKRVWFGWFVQIIAKCDTPLKMDTEDFQDWKNERWNTKRIHKPKLNPLTEVFKNWHKALLQGASWPHLANIRFL